MDRKIERRKKTREYIEMETGQQATKNDAERKKLGNMQRKEMRKVRNFLKQVSLLEECVNSCTIRSDVVFVYGPHWNIPDRFVVYKRQVQQDVVTPIYCIMDLRNDGRRGDVDVPFILPDEWGFNLVPCREFQNRHRISLASLHPKTFPRRENRVRWRKLRNSVVVKTNYVSQKIVQEILSCVLNVDKKNRRVEAWELLYWL